MKILVADDDEVTRKLLQEVLVKEGYSIYLAPSGERAVELLRRESFGVVLSDIRMIELDGMSVLREVKKSGARSAVILMTGFGSMEGAIEAIQEGAFDYVSKPFQIQDLKAVIARAAKHWEALSLRAQSGSSGSFRPIGAATQAVIGKSPKIVEVYKTLARAALSTSNVLIVGEGGTGKELAARAIHDNSSRRDKPFVTLNCSGVSELALEAELLGEAGRSGAVDEEPGGTLYLEEVHDLPPSLQVKLVTVLEKRKSQVRVIAATPKDLGALLREGRFREDLFYRLEVIRIELPPLRARKDDIPELVEHFLRRYSALNQKPVSHVSDEAMELLMKYSWPGNIRELEHVIERAVVMSGTEVLFVEDFPAEIAGGRPQETREEPGPPTSLEAVERSHILKVLQEVRFNKSRASEVLGIDRATLYRKAQRYGIDLRSR